MVARDRRSESRRKRPDGQASAPGKLTRHWAVLKAIRESALTPLERCVLRTLEDHADNTTGEAYPSLATLAREVGTSRRWIMMTLVRLLEAGWLRADRKPRLATVYTVTPPAG